MTRLDLSLSKEEVDDYLDRQRIVRVATATPDGRPHVVPLWFVWLEGTLFLNSTLGNVTVENARRNPAVTVCVDDGEAYEELRGVLLHGSLERADDDPRIPEVERIWSLKYLGGAAPPYRRWRNRVWLGLHPERIVSWDFRRIPEARARRAAGGAGGGRPGHVAARGEAAPPADAAREGSGGRG